jgi:tetratricopeptide (TPR) repeat protein
MRSLLFQTFVLVAICICSEPARAQTSVLKPPRPLPLLEEDREPVSSAEIERLLKVLREERNALETEWREMSKRGKLGKSTSSDDALKRHAEKLFKLLDKELTQNRKKESFAPDPPLPVPETKVEISKKPIDDLPPPKIDDKQAPIIGDPLHFGQTLFRAGMYAEALTAMEKVELVGMKPEERAPILYIKASCQARLGQSAKAIALFEDVVKVRGDERLIDYARWQLEQLHWHRNVENVLQDIRRRLKAAEKAK